MLFVPSEDLTCHNFGSRSDLSDRQQFAWAYQTETKVRFEKLEGRSASNRPPSNAAAPLSSDYLIEVYPSQAAASASAESELEGDVQKLQRKALECMKEIKQQDGSLTPIQIDPEVSTVPPLKETSFNGALSVPPNFLFFEICLECYVGYGLDKLFSGGNDSDDEDSDDDDNDNDDDDDQSQLPKASIMGGAVVTALSCWRDEYIVSLFREVNLEELLDQFAAKTAKYSDKYPERKKKLTKVLLADIQEEYKTRKALLKTILHEYFLSTGDEDGQVSPFHAGDVDVFLQATPLTRALYRTLMGSCGQQTDLFNTIESFVGGIGWSHNELQAFAGRFYGSLWSKYEEDQGGFVYALAKNGLSSMYAPWGKLPYRGEPPSNLPWPRNTQLIMLDPRADMLGALMDFDVSTAACAFDGISVRITPRAALSLVRKVAVVTPFCFEEKRNRRRITKYCRRGFFPAILDPHCLHPHQCQRSFNPLIFGPPADFVEQPIANKKVWQWTSPSAEIIQEAQTNYERYYEHDEHDAFADFVCCCTAYDDRLHMIDLIEESDGHALRFFADLNQWDDEMHNKVNSVPRHLRQACEACRKRYALYLLLNDKSRENEPAWNNTDLREDKAVQCMGIGNNYFRPSFYAGGAFDSTRVRGRARHFCEAQAVLQGQSIAEQLRYIVEHGTVKGYHQRFTFDPLPYFRIQLNSRTGLQNVFGQAMQKTLAHPARPPIGLNPERFLARCLGCSKWLHGYEFGTEMCTDCFDSKPAAV